MTKHASHSSSRLLILILIITFMYIHTVYIDMQNGQILDHSKRHTQYVGEITSNERCKVEQIIRDYKHRRCANKSKSKKIMSDVVIGIIRGALGGIVVGGESGIIPGMITFGTLNGISTWIKLNIPIAPYVRSDDDTAY